ncbi:Arc-like repressor [PinkBerry-associated phage LS06-2018-MD08]|nr:Arc-like repressor [PinkBerry-associated phage LS06-2018-MD08]
MIKITKDGFTQDIKERNLAWYKERGWKKVAQVVTSPTISDNFKNLTKAQLQELCKQKGIDYKPRDNKDMLKAKLDLVNSKTLGERKASNKEFKDSLIKNG